MQLVHAMNLANIVQKSVRLIRSVRADKFVPMENVELVVIPDRVLKVNCVKMELVLLDAEII